MLQKQLAPTLGAGAADHFPGDLLPNTLAKNISQAPLDRSRPPPSGQFFVPAILRSNGCWLA